MKLPLPCAALALGLGALGCSSATATPSSTTDGATTTTTTGAGGATGTGGAGVGGQAAGGAATGAGGTTSAGGAGGATTSAGGAGGASTGSGGGFPCAETASSTLTGVGVHFTASTCTFTLAEAAAGVTLAYDLVVAADVADVVPGQQDAGHCEAPNETGLILHEVLSGGGEQYCKCDVGLCGGIKIPPRTIVAGTYPAAFAWHGRAWNGPSDTMTPEGAPFPPGDYVLDVSALGNVAGQAYEVRTKLPIRLVP